MSEMTQYPPDLRSRYEKVAEALRASGFELELSVPVGSDNPQRFFWIKGAVGIMVDCEAGRVKRIRLTAGHSVVGHWSRIRSLFKFLEQCGLEGGSDELRDE